MQGTLALTTSEIQKHGVLFVSGQWMSLTYCNYWTCWLLAYRPCHDKRSHQQQRNPNKNGCQLLRGDISSYKPSQNRRESSNNLGLDAILELLGTGRTSRIAMNRECAFI